MDNVIIIDVEIDKIPAEVSRTYKRKDGSTGRSIKLRIAGRRQPDQYGNTVTVQFVPPQGSPIERKYVGSGKEYASQYSKNAAPAQQNNNNEEEPF